MLTQTQSTREQKFSPINMSVNDFFVAYAVKRPSRQIQQHNPDFVAAQLRNLDHLLKLNLTPALKRELEMVQKDWREIAKGAPPVFSLEAHLVANIAQMPNSYLVESDNEAKANLEQMEKALASLPTSAPFWAKRKIQTYIRAWQQIVRTYSFDTSRGTSAQRPAKYLAKKAQHRTESQEIRNRMRSSKGKK